ncbi:MAG: hypothetical protein J6I56_03500, partial [Lachnospiraceae bacterium]|nr:hypothetical protein [Lachnospiraceae bacterium]
MNTKTLSKRNLLRNGILAAAGILFVMLFGALPFIKPVPDAVTQAPLSGEEAAGEGVTLPLRAGTYALEVTYEAEDYAVLQVLLSDAAGASIGERGASVIILPYNRDSQRVKFCVPKNGLSARILCSEATEDTELRVHGLSLDYLRKESALYGALRAGGAALGIAAAILLALYLIRQKNRETVLVVAVLAGITMLSCRPLLLDYLPGGHDITFHLYRIAGIAQGLRDGAFPVRMQSIWWNGYGYPVGIFYGDLLLYIPAILHLLGVPLYRAYQVFVLFVNACTALLSYTCFRRMTGSARAGLFSASLYTLSMWRLTDVWIRAAVGEYCAMMFFPLVMLGFYELFADPAAGEETGPGTSGETMRAAVFHLSLGYAGLLLTHLLSTLMVAAFSIVLCLFNLKKLFRGERIVPLAGAAGLSALLSAFFLVPILDYMRRHDLVIMHLSGLIQTHGARLSQLFGMRFDTMAASNILDNTEPEMPLTAGLSVAVILVLAAGDLLYRKGKKETLKQLLILAALSLFMSTHFFPYDFIQEKLPLLFRLIGSVEFPWRYLAVTTALAALMGGLLFSDAEKIPAFRGNGKNLPVIAACLIVMLAAAQGTLLMEQRIEECFLHMRPVDAAALEADSRDSMYLFQGQDWSEMDDRRIRVSDDAVRVSDELRHG